MELPHRPTQIVLVVAGLIMLLAGLAALCVAIHAALRGQLPGIERSAEDSGPVAYEPASALAGLAQSGALAGAADLAAAGGWHTGACAAGSGVADSPQSESGVVDSPDSENSKAGKEETPDARARRLMVQFQLRARDIVDRRVLEVMGRVPRHEFVPPAMRHSAYEDHPLPIGHGQTISQPYIVALMTQLARPKPTDRALDIGTGSGYQAAILAELCKEVYGIEILEPLADAARKRLEKMGYKNVTVRCGDGYRGWPEKAPFDVIIVAAAPDHVPKPLVDQLARGGRLVIPVGRFFQELLLIERRADGSVHRQASIPVRFVPMTGEAQKRAPARTEQ